MKKSTVSGSLADARGQTGEKGVDPERGRVADELQSAKRVEVTADIPFDFSRRPDTTAVLWQKLGLPLLNLDANEGQKVSNPIQFDTELQRRLYRGAIGVRKGTILENRHFGGDYKEFVSKNAEVIYTAIEKLPFDLSTERIAAFADVTLFGLYRFRTSQRLLRGVDARKVIDEFLTAAESLSNSLKSVGSHSVLKSTFDLEIANAVLSTLEQAGIEMRFSAPESKAPTLKTLLYRGSPTEIIDSILSVFRFAVMNFADDLDLTKRIGDSSAYKFVSLMAVYWYGYTGTMPTLSRDTTTKTPRRAKFEPFIEEVAPGISKSTIRAAVEFCKVLLKAQPGTPSA
jgi:hypothetical protein